MRKILFLFIVALIVASCKSNDTDVNYPIIDDANFLPADCSEYQPGGVIKVHFLCTDDTELGSYNIEIHSNFDHHTHGTSDVECDEHHQAGGADHDHESLTGWVYNQDVKIPAGLKSNVVDVDIAIPADAEVGEYHFVVRLTDSAGWQTLKAVPIHIEK